MHVWARTSPAGRVVICSTDTTDSRSLDGGPGSAYRLSGHATRDNSAQLVSAVGDALECPGPGDAERAVMRVRHRLASRAPGLLAKPRTSDASFADFYDGLSPAVLRFFATRTRDGHSAFDLTGETFAKAFEKRRQFRGTTDDQAAAWLWSIARNELARYRRSRSVELEALRRLGLERPSPADDELRRVGKLAEADDLREHMRLALARLPPDQRDVVQLRYVDEMTYREIAQQLGVSRDVVRTRASRALRTLKSNKHVQAAARSLET
jgi:RNA polymerase sigma factor (sigma-70 family)